MKGPWFQLISIASFETYQNFGVGTLVLEPTNYPWVLASGHTTFKLEVEELVDLVLDLRLPLDIFFLEGALSPIVPDTRLIKLTISSLFDNKNWHRA